MAESILPSNLPALDMSGPFIMLAIVIGFAILGVILYGVILWYSFNINAIYYRRRGDYGYIKQRVKLKIGKRKDGSICLEERGSFLMNILGKTRKLPMVDYSQIPKGDTLDLYSPSPDEFHPIVLNKDGNLDPIINPAMKSAYFRQLEEDQRWNFNFSFWNTPAGMMVMLFGVGIIMVIALAVWAPEAAKAASYGAQASEAAKQIYEMNMQMINSSNLTISGQTFVRIPR